MTLDQIVRALPTLTDRDLLKLRQLMADESWKRKHDSGRDAPLGEFPAVTRERLGLE